MVWRLIGYTLWVMAGLWAALYFPNRLAALLGVGVVLLAFLRALGETERGARPVSPEPDPDGGEGALL